MFFVLSQQSRAVFSRKFVNLVKVTHCEIPLVEEDVVFFSSSVSNVYDTLLFKHRRVKEKEEKEKNQL